MRFVKPSANFSMLPNVRFPVWFCRWVTMALLLLFLVLGEARADFLEKINDTLSLSDTDRHFHLQLSGLLDLETYFTDQPPPALIYTDHDFLLNPRLTL